VPEQDIRDAYQCPYCKRFIAASSRGTERHNPPVFNTHVSAPGVRCKGTSEVILPEYPHKKSNHADRVRSLRHLEFEPIPLTEFVTRPSANGLRMYTIALNEGLCGFCKRWVKLSRRGECRLHNTGHDSGQRCEGFQTRPIKTRPRGAWKRRQTKRGPSGEATDGST
jgi:hypothetical protein